MNSPFIVYKQAMENLQKLTLCESEKKTVSSISLIKLKFQEYHVVYRAFPSIIDMDVWGYLKFRLQSLYIININQNDTILKSDLKGTVTELSSASLFKGFCVRGTL